MHNAAFASLGLDWRYLAFPVAPAHLEQAIRGALQMRFVGINLTVPHKILACPMMDALDESARKWGAVNTVRIEARMPGESWQPVAQLGECVESELEFRTQGFNTDANALAQALREDLDWKPEGSKVLLLGVGGAGRVAALRLASEGISSISLVNRTHSKAEALASEISFRFPQVRAQAGYPSDAPDLVLNASSAGLNQDDPLPFDESRLDFRRVARVFDMIYRPRETRLLAAARAAGCRTANGLGMLLHQGAKSLEIWSGKTAPISVMRRALHEAIYTESPIP